MNKVMKMLNKVICVIIVIQFGSLAKAQTSFQYSPKYAKPGDLITFTYEISGTLANSVKPVEAVFFLGQSNGFQKRDEVQLKRNGNIYTGSIQTDSIDCFINLGFHVDNIFDNNCDDYCIKLYNNEQPVRWSHYWLSGFYQFDISRIGGNIDLQKARLAMEEEFRLYPEMWDISFSSYIRLLRSFDKGDTASHLIQKEIETLIRKGLKAEKDYSNLEGLYKLAKLPSQAAFVAELKKGKFPGIKWKFEENKQRFHNVKEIKEKEQILSDLIEKIGHDQNWAQYKVQLNTFYLNIAYAYMENGLWDKAKYNLNLAAIKDTMQLVNVYSNMVAAILRQEANGEFPYALKIAHLSYEYKMKQVDSPSDTKPNWLTARKWKLERMYHYAESADLCARVLYSMGQYKKSYLLAEEAVLAMKEATNYNPIEIHKNYALIAEKVLPTQKLKTQLELFVINHTSSDEIKLLLEKIFIKEKRSSNGFEEYYNALKEKNYLSTVEQLKKKRLNEEATEFSLVNMAGTKIRLSDLDGKVVILYYWFTTCGPCLISLPVMQKLVEKFRPDKDVVFLFINSSERRFPVKETVQKFIQANKYSFEVLLDETNAVSAQFNVAAYPTKVIIDRQGKIAFRITGYDGRQDKLMEELPAMIEIAKEVK